MKKEYDFSNGVRGKYARQLADKRWRVILDPDLVTLLSGDGHVGARLMGFAERRRNRSERRVVCIPMRASDFKGLRPILDRIGAKYEYVPPHPNWLVVKEAARPLRRGAARSKSRKAKA